MISDFNILCKEKLHLARIHSFLYLTKDLYNEKITQPLYQKLRDYVAEAVGFDSRLTAWSGSALTLHWSVIHSRPFESHQLETPP